MPQHMNLKHLPPDELVIYNKLYPIKVALLTLKKGQTFALAELGDISDKVSHLAEDLAALRGIDEDELGTLGDDGHDHDVRSVSSAASSDHGSHAGEPRGDSARNALDALFDTTHQLVLELFAQADKVAPSMLPIYTQLIAIQNALEDMKQDACFTLDDIVVYQRRLREIENAHVRDGKFLVVGHPGVPKGQAILFAKMNYCYRLANTLVLLIDTLEDGLLPYHDEVISIQKDLHALAALPSPATTAILAVQQRLVALDQRRVSNEFRPPPPHDDRPLRGQQLVVAIMEHCYDLITELCKKKDKVAEPLLPLYDHLAAMQARLAELVEHRWEVRPQDLYPFERALQRVEAAMLNGVFYNSPPGIPGVPHLPTSHPGSLNGSANSLAAGVAQMRLSDPKLDSAAAAAAATTAPSADAVTTPAATSAAAAASSTATASASAAEPPRQAADLGPAPAGQASLHYLLYRCHCHVTKLQATIEPVDPALMNIHHHLIAVRKCLVELRRLGGPFTPQELYPFQLKLKSFDDMRVDGKFLVDGEIPAGQGVLHSLLSECYEILNELKAEIEWD
ncbi:hypothetical protein H9P43_006420 [Blastocladiella emersonii ATCC 22665]|nr:hypothetical protein H9P43_006420 [Blastocladiella emersonii ATCC 22665]